MNSIAVIAILSFVTHYGHKTAAESFMATEAQQIALESTQQLLPPEKLSIMIMEHLKSIRSIYPVVADITHRAKWAPGELLIPNVSNSLIQQLNSSQYGPLRLVERLEANDSARIVFAKPYHPARLAERLQEQYDVQEAEANVFSGDGNNVNFHPTAPLFSTYIFQKGWQNCDSMGGCVYMHFWEFSVAPSDNTLTVKLEKEYGSALESV